VAGVDELFSRAVEAQRKGDFATAESDYRQILAIDPRHALSLSNLGVILGRRGELAEAVIVAENATNADPDLAVAHFNLGNLYRRVNRPADAVHSYQRVLQIVPGFVSARLNLGIAVSELGDWTASITHFQKALESQPDVADGLFHLGEALAHVRQKDRAITVLKESLNQSPNLPRNYLALARALFSTGQIDEAILTVEHALRLQPRHAVAHNYLGILLDAAGRFDEAQSHFREAANIRPDFAGAWSNLGLNLSGQGRSSESAGAFAKALELRADPALASCRLAALLDTSTAHENLVQEHLNWAAKYAVSPPEFATAPPLAHTARRIKIGYVFGDFKSSVLPLFLEALLVRHDRQKFHITCYANTSQGGEPIDRLRKLAEDWHSLAAVDDAAASERIRADEIDVLVDLNGHTVGNRLPLFAKKPARRCLSLFGYPATTGLKAIDYRISDACADPPAVADALSVEKVLRMPEIGRLYIPPASSPLPSPLPHANQNSITFGCLNRPGKLSPPCMETWARLLHNVPNSRLVLQVGRSREMARSLMERFARAGIDSSRLTMVLSRPEEEYFHAYQSIDVALDPFPFNGRTTTCDALWMGVPVLTVAGQDCRSRQGVSILTSVGLADFIAESPEKLVGLASIWAAQTDALADLRSCLRDMMTQSPLMDAAGFVRNLEEAYATALGPL